MIHKFLVYFFILISTIFLVKCRKPENRKCYKSVGKIQEKTFDLRTFDTLIIGPKLRVKLIQSNENKIVVLGGENLINFFIQDYSNANTLSLTNKNKCNFLRKTFKSLEVTIYFTSIKHINFKGSDDLTSDLITQDRLSVKSDDGNGTMRLNINTTDFIINATTNSGDYFVSGNTQNAYVSVGSNSYCDVRELSVVGYYNLTNGSQGDMYVNGDGAALDVLLKTRGNIYYFGNPESLTLKESSKGKLIKL